MSDATTAHDAIAEAFLKYDAANPKVWELFQRFTHDALRAGRVRFSADAILHRIRWFTQVETKDEAGFKINDHFSALYARKFMRTFPQHSGFFATRARTAS